MKVALNEFHIEQNMDEPSLQEVINVTSDFWTKDDAFGRAAQLDSGIALLDKRRIIQNYLILSRGEEEMKMIEQDVHNSLQFLIDKIKIVSDKCDQLQTDSNAATLFRAGCCSLLQQKLLQLRYLLNNMRMVFSVSGDKKVESTDHEIASSSESDSDYSDTDDF